MQSDYELMEREACAARNSLMDLDSALNWAFRLRDAGSTDEIADNVYQSVMGVRDKLNEALSELRERLMTLSAKEANYFERIRQAKLDAERVVAEERKLGLRQ